MKKLSKAQMKERAEIVGRVSDAENELDNEIDRYNEACEAAWEAVAAAVRAVNDATSEANEFREGILSEQEGYFDERSERWQESEAGEAYSEWKAAWGEEFEEIELDRPEALETPTVPAMALDDLPEEAGA